MKDFHGKRRRGKESRNQIEIRPAASSEEGVLQQARRFRYGPFGLQELAKKRKRRATKPRNTDLTPMDTCIEAPGVIQGLSPQPILFAKTSAGGKNDHITPLSNCTSQPTGGKRPAQGDVSAGRRLHPQPSLTPLLGSMDPFKTLPLPDYPRTEILISYGP